jgi:hypothetical protein
MRDERFLDFHILHFKDSILDLEKLPIIYKSRLDTVGNGGGTTCSHVNLFVLRKRNGFGFGFGFFELNKCCSGSGSKGFGVGVGVGLVGVFAIRLGQAYP